MQPIIITIGYGCKPISNRQPLPRKILIFPRYFGSNFPKQKEPQGLILEFLYILVSLRKDR